MDFKILDLSQKNEWSNYLAHLPAVQQDIYFTPEYYELYEKNCDGKAKCFVFEKDGDIALYPFLINSVNELGYKLDDEYYDIQGAYGYDGVIASSYDDEYIHEFFKEFNKFCINNNIIAEFTRFHPLLGNNQFSSKELDIIYDRKTVYIRLDQGYNNIFNNEFSSNNRNMIRKGAKTLYCEIGQSHEALNKFIKIYKQTMNRIDADSYYLFSDEYFESILNKHMYIINSYDKISDELFGSMILMIYKKYAHYHLSGRSKNCENNAVNNYMLNEAIKFSINKGCKFFHFGGGNTSNNNDGLLKFKKKFSKNYGNFYIGKKIHNRKIYDIVINQWKNKFPESYKNNINKILGYREIG